MATIGDVWDDTLDVLAARARTIVPVALGALLLPAVVAAVVRAATAGSSGGAAAIASLVALVAAVIALVGRLAITALALDTTTTGPMARSRAGRALLPLIGVLLVLGAAGIVLLLPILFVLTAAGWKLSAMQGGADLALPALTGASMWFARLYALALMALFLWVLARVKLLLAAIVLAEGQVIGAIGRAAALTRGMTWRLIGVVILYYIVLWVSVLAVTRVGGLGFLLVLGGDARLLAGVLATIVGAVVGTAFDTLAQVFAARLYVALTGSGMRMAA